MNTSLLINGYLPTASIFVVEKVTGMLLLSSDQTTSFRPLEYTPLATNPLPTVYPVSVKPKSISLNTGVPKGVTSLNDVPPLLVTYFYSKTDVTK